MSFESDNYDVVEAYSGDEPSEKRAFTHRFIISWYSCVASPDIVKMSFCSSVKISIFLGNVTLFQNSILVYGFTSYINLMGISYSISCIIFHTSCYILFRSRSD